MSSLGKLSRSNGYTGEEQLRAGTDVGDQCDGCRDAVEVCEPLLPAKHKSANVRLDHSEEG